MKTMLFLSAIVTLFLGTMTPVSAGPSGTYDTTLEVTLIDDDGSQKFQVEGTLKLSLIKGELTVLNPSGNQGRSLLRFSKRLKSNASIQKIKGTIQDLNYEDGKGSFTGKLVRKGKHYKLTADMRMTYSDGVMRGTITATK